jgi:hypothetical protein
MSRLRFGERVVRDSRPIFLVSPRVPGGRRSVRRDRDARDAGDSKGHPAVRAVGLARLLGFHRCDDCGLYAAT